MKRINKARLSTAIGCLIGGATLTGPLAGQMTSDFQCKRGLCSHEWHRYRYAQHMQAKAFRKAFK